MTAKLFCKLLYLEYDWIFFLYNKKNLSYPAYTFIAWKEVTWKWEGDVQEENRGARGKTQQGQTRGFCQAAVSGVIFLMLIREKSITYCC